MTKIRFEGEVWVSALRKYVPTHVEIGYEFNDMPNYDDFKEQFLKPLSLALGYGEAVVCADEYEDSANADAAWLEAQKEVQE